MSDGFYVFVEYMSHYKNTKNHSEIILLKQNDQRKWKILDYYYEFEEGKDDAGMGIHIKHLKDEEKDDD